jgi:hypothetical protein
MKLQIKHIVGNCAIAAALLWTSVANAATYQFTLTGDYSAQWELQSTLVPDSVSLGEFFVIWDVTGTFPGSAVGLTDIAFFNGASNGGVELYDFYGARTLVATDGTQLYTGAESAPVFRLGNFSLTQFQGTGSYALNIRDLSAPVPEPETYAMLLAGLGLMGVAARRRKSRA